MAKAFKASVKFDNARIKAIENTKAVALEQTATAILSELIVSGTMPYDDGTMQNDDTFVKMAKNTNRASIITSSPQARKLYYHPEYNFQDWKNSNAGGMWFAPYIDGEHKNFTRKTYAKLLQRRMEALG